MGASELSAVLWRERELLGILEFKLEVEQILLSSGKSKWMDRATAEIDAVVAGLRELNLLRDVELSRLAGEWGLEDTASLREIVAAAPDDTWRDIFHSHLVALVAVTGRIAALRDANETSLRHAIRSTQETIASIGETPGTYDSSGRTDVVTSHATVLDRDI